MTAPAEPVRWRRAGLVTVAGNGALQALSFASGLLAGRLLGPAGRGDLALVQTIPGLLAIVGMLGLPEACVYFAARRRDRASAVVGTSLVLVIACSAVAIGIGALAVAIGLRASDPAIRAAAFVNLLVCPVLAVYTVSYQPLRAINRLAAWNSFRVVTSASWVAILLVAWATDVTEAIPIAMTYLLAQAVIAVGALLVTRASLGGFSWDRGLRSTLVRFGAPNAAASVPQVLNLRFDQVIIGAVLSARELGLYVVAVGWSSVVAPLLHSIANLLFPTVAALAPDRRSSTVGLGLRLAVIIAVAETVVVVAVTPTVLPLLLGDGFAAAVGPACILVVAGAVSGLNVVMEEALRGLGQPGPILGAEMAGLAATIAGLALVLDPYGIVGAAWVSLVAYLVLGGLLLRAIRRRTGLSIRMLVVWRRADYEVLRHRM